MPRIKRNNQVEIARRLGLHPKRRVQQDERDPKDIIESLRMSARAIVSGWDTSFIKRQKAMREAEAMLDHHDPNVKIAAIKVIQASDTMRLKALELADKTSRLDNGEATENNKLEIVWRDNPIAS